MSVRAGVGRLICVMAFALALGTTMAGPAGAETPANYEGEDGGTLIYSVGNIEIPMNFTFAYRRVRAPSGDQVSDGSHQIECACVGFFRARKGDVDYEGRERGKVIIRRLPAGEYVIYDFGFGGTLGAIGYDWSSRTKLVIPFMIRAGEATYIGNFARAPSLGTPLESRLGAAGFFVISDKSERDLPIAQSRLAASPSVTVSVVNAADLGHPAILASEPR